MAEPQALQQVTQPRPAGIDPTICRRPPQRGQRSMSRANTRFSKVAHERPADPDANGARLPVLPCWPIWMAPAPWSTEVSVFRSAKSLTS
jgi:hypothetical protein